MPVEGVDLVLALAGEAAGLREALGPGLGPGRFGGWGIKNKNICPDSVRVTVRVRVTGIGWQVVVVLVACTRCSEG